MIGRFLKDELVSVAVKKLNYAFSLKSLLSTKKDKVMWAKVGFTYVKPTFALIKTIKIYFIHLFKTLTL